MKALFDRLRREPAVILTFLVALFGLLAAFGWEMSKEQTGAIISLVTVVVGFVIRSQVTPTIAVGAAEQNDVAGNELVAGPASALPNETPVDVVPAVDVFGEDTLAGGLAGRTAQARHGDRREPGYDPDHERGDLSTRDILLIAALVLVGVFVVEVIVHLL